MQTDTNQKISHVYFSEYLMLWGFIRHLDKSVHLKIIFHISTKTYVVGSFKHPKHIFKMSDNKIVAILC